MTQTEIEIAKAIVKAMHLHCPNCKKKNAEIAGLRTKLRAARDRFEEIVAVGGHNATRAAQAIKDIDL